MPFGHLLTGNQALMDSEYPKVQTEFSFFSACEWGTRPLSTTGKWENYDLSHWIETYGPISDKPICFIGFPIYVFVKQNDCGENNAHPPNHV